MNDDDIERRLRRALRAKAEGAVDDQRAAARRTTAAGRTTAAARSHPRAVPMIAAAALVSTVAIGSAALVAFTGHHDHPREVDSESIHVTSDRTPPPRTDQRAAVVGTTAPTRSPIARPGATGTAEPSPPPYPRSSPTRTAAPTTVPTSPSTTGPQSSRPSRTPSTRPTTPSRTPTTQPTTTQPTTTQPTTTPPVNSVPVCTTAALSLSIGGDRMVGTDGGDYTILDLTNSGSACTLTGYPGIAIYDGTGPRIGGPARHRASPTPARIVLGHGGRAEVELYDLFTSAPDCTANYNVGRTLRFTPPGQSTSITIDYGYSACQLSVTSIHPPKAHPATE